MSSSVKTFKFSDIEIVYFCAGARNHKLKALFTNAKLCFELDERSASFKALGAAKAGKVAAVCVTSGTAVSQCLSAVVEAHYSGTPFILVSGDRPKRLHGSAAPQTIDHFAATRGYAAEQIEVLDAELSGLEVSDPSYPLHINVLVDSNHDAGKSWERKSFEALPEFLQKFERTLFLVSHDNVSLRGVVESLLKKTDYVFAETLSGAKDLSPIANEFELLKMYREGAFDSVVRIGHTPLSKLWRVIDTGDIPVLSVDSRGYSGLSRGEVIKVSEYDFTEKLSIKRNRHKSYFDWSIIKQYPQSQKALIQAWQEELPEGAAVYLGNSSVIRDFEAVQTKLFKTFGNRGANGIDGQLSTAIGMAQAMDEKLYCLLGDLTFLYDYAASFDLPGNLEVVVLDNEGGRIFERIGIQDEIILRDKNNSCVWPENDQIKIIQVSPDQTLACFKELSK